MRKSGARKDNTKRLKRRVYWLRKYKTSVGCENCGYNKNPVALDFAHIDPMDKHLQMTRSSGANGMSRMYKRICVVDKKKNRFYLKELINEVRKCKILCKNCHVVETYENGEFHNGKKISKARGGSYSERNKMLYGQGKFNLKNKSKALKNFSKILINKWKNSFFTYRFSL